MKPTNEDHLLKLLAIAIVENPRSTIKELAETVGISKATLHRFCGTRKNLEQILLEKADTSLKSIIEISESNFNDYRVGVKKLINAHYENKEFLRFSCTLQPSIDEIYWIPYLKAIDSFFLNGQKDGAFKIDFNVTVLSEIFITIICGMIDSERRGRIAPNGIIDTFENFFLHGALNDAPSNSSSLS
jgi:TetR/AcrR family transcriptional regulator, mexCD-oprJ operon repressor